MPFRRIMALSVAVTLFAAPIASAQTPEAAPVTARSANATLLSNAAFARLVQQPQMDATRTRLVKDPPRIDLRPTLTAPSASRAPGYRMQSQGSWASRHKVALGWSIVGGLLGSLFLYSWWTCHGDEC